MRIFRFNTREEVEKIMHDIGVDPHGIKIMLPKAQTYLIRLNSVNNIAANIIKQEMLSLGAEAAITRDALTVKSQKTDVLLIGSLNQLEAFAAKIKYQPFGLGKLACELLENLKQYTKENFILNLRDKKLELGRKTLIMGIINMTPDSFSGDGLCKEGSLKCFEFALAKAKQMVKDGADIIDVGGQSSRPGAKFISTKEELSRTIAAVKLISKNINKPISIDTRNYKVARAALDAGAQIVNDITGLRQQAMIKVCAKQKAAVVIMHMLGIPENMQNRIEYVNLMEDIAGYLKKSVDRAQAAGIGADKIIIDPGLGFGKTAGHNLEILKNLKDFKILGKPLLVGASRKSFIGKILGVNKEKINTGTLAASIIAAKNGADILRVHNVKETKEALKILDAIKNAA